MTFFNLFSSRKKEQEMVAIFDLGSASIGGALVVLPKGDDTGRKPNIIYSVRYPVAFQEDIDFERFTTLMLEALEEVARKMKEAAPVVPQRTFCFLASPWYASQTRIIKLSKLSPFVFTEKIANGLIQKELQAFEDSYLKKYATLSNRPRVIEKKNIGVTLNGYKTNKPFGKKAKELEISLFISMSPEDVLDSIEERIKTFLTVPRVEFSSFLFSSFVVTRDVFPDKKNFLLLDIGGEITDISLVKNDVLSESLSFPFGKNVFIRRIASRMKRSKEEAMSLLSLYLDGRAEKSLSQKIDRIMQETKDDWINHFEKALVDISGGLSLPSTIFFTADPYVVAWFKEAIKKERFSQYTLTEREFNVIVLEARSLHGFCEFGSDVERDPFLILESIYLNRAAAL